MGAAALALALLAGVFYGNAVTEKTATLGANAANPEAATTTIVDLEPAEEPAMSTAAAATEMLPDTASQTAYGWMQVAVTNAPLRTSWTDSLASPTVYLQPDDWVRVLRRARTWVQVQGPADRSAVGWIRRQALANLRPSAPPDDAEAEPPASETTESNETADNSDPEATATNDEATGTAAPATTSWPTGSRTYVGRIGNYHARFALDWQPDGQLSGTYRLDEQPGLVLRLTGAPAADGSLHLAEFTKGRLSARCVLQRQGEGFVGTMFNTDGRQFEMTLEAE